MGAVEGLEGAEGVDEAPGVEHEQEAAEEGTVGAPVAGPGGTEVVVEGFDQRLA